MVLHFRAVVHLVSVMLSQEPIRLWELLDRLPPEHLAGQAHCEAMSPLLSRECENSMSHRGDYASRRHKEGILRFQPFLSLEVVHPGDGGLEFTLLAAMNDQAP